MRFYITLLLTLLFQVNLVANPIKKTSSSWVKTISGLNDNYQESSGGYRYVLIDYQANIPEEEVYQHISVKLLNSEGVQSMSEISMNYDPSYQKLIVHVIRIIRNGKVIDKLAESIIHTLQRETNMERNMYDGTVTAVVNLTDVRVGDVLEYAYTVKFFNPVNKGNFTTQFFQQYTEPVGRVYGRLLTNAQHPIKYQLKNNAEKPTKVVKGGVKEYVWDVVNPPNIVYDVNTPQWYVEHKHVNVTTFSNWKVVLDWALPLYECDALTFSNLNTGLPRSKSTKERITYIINWVQDDIRYLGFESGIGAYKPNTPSQVVEQRYGDCKDKSLLLVALLRGEGVEAYPVLVNSFKGIHIREGAPSNEAFNHCVVHFKLDDQDYFVDPTISQQGGDIGIRQFPYYSRGLLLKEGETSLMKIPMKGKSTMNVKEIITVEEKGGEAKLWVRTKYTGAQSDRIRAYFSANNIETIQKEYTTFYSNLYPDIKSTRPLQIFDNSRNTSNEIFIEEHYVLPGFWQLNEESNYMYGEIYPLVLESFVTYPKTPERTMPYYLGIPFNFSQTTEVVLPENWPLSKDDLILEGEGFKFERVTYNRGNRVFVTNTYELNKADIPSGEVGEFLEKHKTIFEGLSFMVMYTENTEGFSLSWISILISMIGIGLGGWISLRIYKSFDPETLSLDPGMNIGGWIVIPGIGLIFTPIIILFQILTKENFDHHTWLTIWNGFSENVLELVLIVGVELCYNFMFLTFAIMLLISFFKRRSSVPKLIIIFYIINAVVPISESYLLSEMVPGSFVFLEDDELITTTVRSFLALAIWGSYFQHSKRVKNTFVMRYVK